MLCRFRTLKEGHTARDGKVFAALSVNKELLFLGIEKRAGTFFKYRINFLGGHELESCLYFVRTRESSWGLLCMPFRTRLAKYMSVAADNVGVEDHASLSTARQDA